MNVKIIALGLICVLLLMLVSCSSSRDPYEPTYSYFNEKAETPDPTDSEEIAESGYMYDPSCFTTGGYTNQWMGLSFTPTTNMVACDLEINEQYNRAKMSDKPNSYSVLEMDFRYRTENLSAVMISVKKLADPAQSAEQFAQEQRKSYNESLKPYASAFSVVWNGDQTLEFLGQEYILLNREDSNHLDSTVTETWELYRIQDGHAICIYITALNTSSSLEDYLQLFSSTDEPHSNSEPYNNTQQTHAQEPDNESDPHSPSINGYTPGVFSNGVYTSQWLNLKYQNDYAATNYAPSRDANLATINSNPNYYRITDVDLGGANADAVLIIKVQKLSDLSITIKDLIAKEQAEESAFFNSNPYTPSHTWTEPTEFNLVGETYMTQQVTLHVNYNGQTYDETNWYLYRIKDGHLVIMRGIGQVSSQTQFFSYYG